MNFAAQLRQWRTFRGFSQAALARAAGIPRPNLIDLETGRRDCTLKTLYRLANALELRPGVLLDESPQKKASLDRHEVDRVARSLCFGKPSLSRELENYKKVLFPLVVPTLRAVGFLPEDYSGRSAGRFSSARLRAQDQLGLENLDRLLRRINKLAAAQV